MTKEEKKIDKYAKLAYEKIIESLLKRHQFDWWYEPINRETKQEIKNDMVNDISVAMFNLLKDK